MTISEDENDEAQIRKEQKDKNLINKAYFALSPPLNQETSLNRQKYAQTKYYMTYTMLW